MTLSRRTFLAGVPAALALGQVRADQDKPRLKIAAVTTTYFKYSHAEHIVDRFLDGYGWEGRHHRPPMDVVSLYVDQVGDNDLSRERAERHPEMKIYPSIGEALTLGGKKLAVDAVLVVVRAGKTPRDYLTKALQSLNSTKVMGVVLNGADLGIASKYYYYSANGA